MSKMQTYDDDQGPRAIQALQEMAGLKVTIEEARDGRPDLGEQGWNGMTDQEKLQTTVVHTKFFGRFEAC